MKSFALEVKELPGQDPAAPQSPAPSPTLSNDDVPRWSGDVYQEGDETTPEDSEWSFTGSGGEQAWLDRSEDGAITGWVRDPDGTVYRYTDADAWAVEVDDAGMSREGGAPTGPGAEGEMGGGEDPNAAQDPTQGDSYTDPEGEDVDDEQAMEDAAFEAYSDTSDPDAEGGEEADPDEAEPDADVDDDEEADPNEGEPDDDEDDEADTGNPFAKKKRGVEGKVLRLAYR